MCPMIEPDFSEILEQLPEGQYKVRVVDADQKTSQAGKPYVRWQLVVFDATDSRCNGKAIWYSTPITGKGAFRLQQFYRAATGEKLAGSFDTNSLFGRELLAMIVNGQDESGVPTGFSEIKALKSIAA